MSHSDLIARTPATRNRFVDLLRAVAIVLVVLGHWLAVTLTVRDGELGGNSILAVASWTHPLTWVFQVMPIFFLVGGFANAASWRSNRRRGLTWQPWLAGRTRRLLLPTSVFIGCVVVATAVLRLAGVDAEVVATAAWLVGISLWFLAVYLAAVALVPVTYDWHRRWGLRVPVAMAATAALADLLRIGLDVPYIGEVNFLVVWLLLHQLGYAWQDGTLVARRSRPRLLAGGGLAALLLLVTVGPYPVSMVSVPGEPLQNASPPSLALLALGVTQTGVVLLFRHAGSRLCARPRVWLGTVAVNQVVMTAYLWHLVPVALAAPALHLTGMFPQPEVASAGWLALRPVWVAALLSLLLPLLWAAGRFERLPGPPASAREGEVPPGWAAPVVVVAVALICVALVRLTVGGLSTDEPGGVPWLGLAPYVAGSVLLQLALRSRSALGAPVPQDTAG